MERWASGMRSEGFRQLDEREFKYVVHLRRRFRRRVSQLALGALSWMAILTGVTILTDGSSKAVGSFVGVWFLAGMMAAAAGILWARDGWSRATALGKDLARGEVESLSAPEATGSDRLPRVDVLPVSGLVLSVNGTPNTKWSTMVVRAVAAPQRAPWIDYFNGGSESDRVRERAMTNAELEELRSLATSTDYVPRSGVLIALTWGVFFIGTRIVGEGGEPRLSPGALGGIVGVVLLTSLGIRLRALWNLRRDLTAKTIRVVVFATERGSAEVPVSLEYLPCSRRVWTLNHHPAPWRLQDDL